MTSTEPSPPPPPTTTTSANELMRPKSTALNAETMGPLGGSILTVRVTPGRRRRRRRCRCMWTCVSSLRLLHVLCLNLQGIFVELDRHREGRFDVTCRIGEMAAAGVG